VYSPYMYMYMYMYIRIQILYAVIPYFVMGLLCSRPLCGSCSWARPAVLPLSIGTVWRQASKFPSATPSASALKDSTANAF
jgi:hypothetical protein